MSNVNAAAAARAAGLTEPELAALEDSGVPARKPDYAALAALIGLNPAKLESIAAGWTPAEKDLGGFPWRSHRSRPGARPSTLPSTARRRALSSL